MTIKIKLHQIFQNDYLEVKLDKTLKFIYVEWFQHPNSPDFRRLFQILADLTIEHQCRYWLSDARAIHYIEFADQNWLLREMAPMLTKTNLKKFARLTTEESMSQLDIIRVLSQVERLTELGIKTELEIFTNKQAALNWLFEEAGTVEGNI